jgi:hypothetical protein
MQHKLLLVVLLAVLLSSIATRRSRHRRVLSRRTLALSTPVTGSVTFKLPRTASVSVPFSATVQASNPQTGTLCVRITSSSDFSTLRLSPYCTFTSIPAPPSAGKKTVLPVTSDVINVSLASRDYCITFLTAKTQVSLGDYTPICKVGDKTVTLPTITNS